MCYGAGHSMERMIILDKGNIVQMQKSLVLQFQGLPTLCKLKPPSPMLPYLNYGNHLCIF